MTFNCEQPAGRTGKALGGPWRIWGRPRTLVGVLFLALLQNYGQAFSAPLPAPYSVTLEWNASPSPAVVGYHLYYGTTSGIYSDSVITGNLTTVSVSGLWTGVTYYFAITSVGADGQESAHSGEISYQQALPGAEMQIHSVADGSFALTVTGPVGQTYDIEATPDFSVWTVIGTATVGTSGSLNFTDTNAAAFSQRFYRTQTKP